MNYINIYNKYRCKEMSSLNNGIYLNLTSFEEYSKAGDACFSLTYENVILYIIYI